MPLLWPCAHFPVCACFQKQTVCEDEGSALQSKQIVMGVPTLERMCDAACVDLVELESTTRLEPITVSPQPSFCARYSRRHACHSKVCSRALSYLVDQAMIHHFTLRRDLYLNIAIPGGIAMKSFSEAWALFCKGMDYNDYSMLQSPAKQLLSTVSK